MWDVIQSALVAMLTAVAAVGIAVIATALLWGAVGRLAPHDYHDVPMVQRLAVIAGLLFAIGVVLGGPTARAYAEARLFAIGGPWDLAFGEFLLQRIVVPFGVAGEIARKAAGGQWRIIYPAATGLVLAAVSTFLAFRFWRGAMASRAALGTLILAFGVAVIAFYVAETTLWLVHKLNFWALAVLTVLYQRHRNAQGH